MLKFARILACAAAVSATCASAQTYDLQVLVYDGYAVSIGRTGDVALSIPYGNGCQSNEAAVYRDGQVDYLACNAEVHGVNAGGDVVGNAGGGKLWMRSGQEIAIPTPRGKHPTSANAINDTRMVVGTYAKSHTVSRCLGWTQEGGSFDLGLPVGATSCVAAAVNNKSWVAGYVEGGPGLLAFVWKNGHFHLLPNLDGAVGCRALAMNRHGDAVGACHDGSGFDHPVLWRDGNVIDLYPTTGTVSGYAYGIDDAGVIVGMLIAPNWHGAGAVIFGEAGPIDLTQLVGNVDDWTFDVALGIDKAGEIIAQGYSPTQGGAAAVKLVPVGNDAARQSIPSRASGLERSSH